MIPLTAQLKNSIRFRLTVAFLLVGILAVFSALHSWYSANKTEIQISSIVTETLPLIRHSHELSKEVTLLAVAATELSQITTSKELSELSESLGDRTYRIEKEIQRLSQFNLKSEYTVSLDKKIKLLISDLEQQIKVTREIIRTYQQLENAVKKLTQDQERFIDIARPRISESYTDFLKKGRSIKTELRGILSQSQKNTNKADLDKIDETLRVGFETLIHSSASEMKSNLEMVSITFLISGILFETAKVDNEEELSLLQKRYQDSEQLKAKLELILANTSPENTGVLVAASPIFSAGKGPGSIFQLRKRELDLRRKSHLSSDKTIVLAKKLSKDVAYLAQFNQEYVDSTFLKLKSDLQRYQLFAYISASIIILICFTIGFFYLERRVITRLNKLREAMELQADGIETKMPADYYGDEISQMTGALEKFVYQREKYSDELKNTNIKLHEAQDLAKIGNCERDNISLVWHWSKGFYNIIGYTEKSLPASESNFWQVVHPKDRLEVELFFNTLSSPTNISEVEFQMITRDEENITVRALWKISETNPQIQHGTIQDITERKKVEDNLLKIRKTESISILAGGIAHDFNNLLTGILGNIALVAKLINKDVPANDLLNQAEQAALRARELTNKLLTFSSGGTPLKTVTHLPLLLKESCEFALSGSNVNCEFFIEESLWPVDMDASHINQIVHNLVLNADQSMPGGGTVIITCTNVEISASNKNKLPPAQYVKLTVSDTGTGIKSDHLERIFDPYYSTKGFYADKGSGLGLAIVQSIVTKHGGSIEVFSQLNKGTEFIIHLPALPDTEEAASPLQSQTAGASHEIKHGSGHIIVMDDEEIIREVARQMLEELGYTVSTAKDGKETIEIYDKLIRRGNMVSCVIMDLTIPGSMGGKEAIHDLLKKHPSAKVIVSSGYTTDPVIENYKLYGFSGLILKPYKLDELSRIVAEVIDMM